MFARWIKGTPFLGEALIVNAMGEADLDHATRADLQATRRRCWQTRACMW
jgi:hypothetical protein